MMVMPDEGVAFTSVDEGELVGYKSVSRLAIASLVLGLLSFLALTSPVLWALPLAGAICGALALRAIAAEPDRYTGRRAGVAGLVLSLLFLGWGVAASFTQSSILYSQARQVADEWFARLHNGDFAGAHQLTMAQANRKPLGEVERHYLIHDEARGHLKEFKQTMLVQPFAESDDEVKVEFMGTRGVYFSDFGEIRVKLRYDVRSGGASDPKTLPVVLTVKRTPLESGEVDWMVENFLDVER